MEALRDSLPVGKEWDEREEAILDLASTLAADIDRLEADIDLAGVRIEGRAGTRVLNQAVGEARQSKVALTRILSHLDLPGSETATTLRARKAAEARWKRKAS